MENELLNALSVHVSIISSVVAISAVSICTIISSVITQRGAKRAKQTELIFYEMVQAYYDFLQACEEFSDPNDIEQILRFSNASTRALLFSSSDTQDLISRYGNSVTQVLKAKENSDPEILKIAKDSGTIRGLLLKSMQKDLRK